ncbi:hypothetical protein [Comamonas sp. NLF-1-9]|uniref:hypothetical protein n=1 Tax=Comamonas sp. NLF-1-9 TaxID=2853163 RepID=UPI001C47B2C5|nr:hypothetical protein [Comamonas sp. NLF-1-9]QXL83550.1 hypothetical protein KUD94_09800 [Comamonas sp. NLF-1-9]
MYKTLAHTLVIAGALALGGCASAPPAQPQDIVRARAQERVDLLLARNFDQAYDYLAPSYRALNDRKAYRNRFGTGAAWVEPKVTQVKCDEVDRCVATVELGVLVVAPGFGGKPIQSEMFETWIKEDGQWWFYQRD